MAHFGREAAVKAHVKHRFPNDLSAHCFHVGCAKINPAGKRRAPGTADFGPRADGPPLDHNIEEADIGLGAGISVTTPNWLRLPINSPLKLPQRAARLRTSF